MKKYILELGILMSSQKTLLRNPVHLVWIQVAYKTQTRTGHLKIEAKTGLMYLPGMPKIAGNYQKQRESHGMDSPSEPSKL